MIKFGSFQIDPRTWLLTSDNEPVELSPRLVEILGFIIERQGSIVTKDELLEPLLKFTLRRKGRR